MGTHRSSSAARTVYPRNAARSRRIPAPTSVPQPNRSTPRVRGSACGLHVFRAGRRVGLREVDVPARCLLLCPNHTGFGRRSHHTEGAWETPSAPSPS